jgi:hypothetical protein
VVIANFGQYGHIPKLLQGMNLPQVWQVQELGSSIHFLFASGVATKAIWASHEDTQSASDAKERFKPVRDIGKVDIPRYHIHG